jgi:hypothetical protein
VKATDKSGNPVMMFLSPDSITEISADDSGGQNARAGAGGMFTSTAIRTLETLY